MTTKKQAKKNFTHLCIIFALFTYVRQTATNTSIHLKSLALRKWQPLLPLLENSTARGGGVYLPNSSTMGKMWYKDYFQAELSQFEFRVFFFHKLFASSSSSSSSRRPDSLNSFDPCHLSLWTIVLDKTVSSIHTEWMNVSFCWSANTSALIIKHWSWVHPYFFTWIVCKMGGWLPYSCSFVGCCCYISVWLQGKNKNTVAKTKNAKILTIILKTNK